MTHSENFRNVIRTDLSGSNAVSDVHLVCQQRLLWVISKHQDDVINIQLLRYKGSCRCKVEK